MGFGSAGIFLFVGWLHRDARSWSGDDGFGYSLGIVAVSCMLLLLMYPLRKRLRFLSFLGATKHWFRTHMILGTLGPVLALYHCNFTIGSANGRGVLEIRDHFMIPLAELREAWSSTLPQLFGGIAETA